MSTQQLAATLSSITTTDPARYVRAGLTRATTLGLSRRHALTMIRTHGGPQVAQLLDHPKRLDQIVNSTLTHRTRSASPAAARAVRVRAARQVVARVLGGTTTYTQRAILALLGLRIIDGPDGWASTQISAGAIGVELGVSERAVVSAMAGLERDRKIRAVRRTKGHATVWKIEPLRDPNERVGLGDLYDSIGALADGRPDPVADAIRSVTDPKFGYSDELTHRHWVGTVAVAAQVVMPASLRVHQATVRQLDRYTESGEPAARKAAAVEAAAVRAAERIEAVEAARETWGRARAWVEQVEDSAGPAHKAVTALDRKAWLETARVGVRGVPEAERPGLGRYLANHLRKAKWGTTTAAKASQAVVR